MLLAHKKINMKGRKLGFSSCRQENSKGLPITPSFTIVTARKYSKKLGLSFTSQRALDLPKRKILPFLSPYIILCKTFTTSYVTFNGRWTGSLTKT